MEIKNEMLQAFKKLYKGKRLLAVQLNGFNHSLFYDSGKSDSEIEIERHSVYTNMGDAKGTEFFKAVELDNNNISFKHNPQEIIFVHPSER